MSAKHLLSRAAATFVAVILAAALTAGAALAASEFEGTWKTEDTKGNPFQITLSADGKAKGDRADEGLAGTWKAEGDSVVITWDFGLDYEDRQGRRQVQETGVREGRVERHPDPHRRRSEVVAANVDRDFAVQVAIWRTVASRRSLSTRDGTRQIPPDDGTMNASALVPCN